MITLGCIFLVAVVGAHVGRMFFPNLTYLDLACKGENTQLLLLGAGASFASAILLKILSPVKQLVPKNRCKKCNNKIPRGDVYCANCLREMKYKTVNRT